MNSLNKKNANNLLHELLFSLRKLRAVIQGEFSEEKSFDVLYDRKRNSFDLSRFFLASFVIYSHSYPLLYGVAAGNFDILFRFSNGQVDFGAFAVNSFFVISGFLVLQSLLSSNSIHKYLANRSLRIFPALLSCLVLTSFILGPFITNLPINQYLWGAEGVSPFRYLFSNITFSLFSTTFSIRDLFAQNPYPSSVNGSLWTLEFEFGSYLLLIVLYIFGIIKHKRLFGLLTIFNAVLLILYNNYNLVPFNLPPSWWILSSGVYGSLIRLQFYFTAGCFIYLYKDRLIYSTKYILLGVFVLLVSLKSGHFNDLALIFLPYIVIGISIRSKIKLFTKYGDFSYGIYVYAYPIEQLMVKYYRNDLNAIRLTIYSFLLTLIISVLSWNIIEKPALLLKKKIP